MKYSVCTVAALALAAGSAQAQIATGTPFNISDNTINSGTAVISGGGPITSVVLALPMSHTYMADLIFRLIAPDGTTVTFATFAGGANNLGGVYTIVDGVPNSFQFPITGGGAVTPGIYAPQNPFSAFNGLNPNGTWTLQVEDTAAADTGVVGEWQLRIIPTPGAAALLGLGGLVSLRRRR